MNSNKIQYKDTTSDKYTHVYSNASLATVSPSGDIVIDFCEERLDPFRIVEQSFDEDNELVDTEFNRDLLTVIIERERKVSVTLNQTQALDLARWIMSNCENGEDNHETGD